MTACMMDHKVKGFDSHYREYDCLALVLEQNRNVQCFQQSNSATFNFIIIKYYSPEILGYYITTYDSKISISIKLKLINCKAFITTKIRFDIHQMTLTLLSNIGFLL